MAANLKMVNVYCIDGHASVAPKGAVWPVSCSTCNADAYPRRSAPQQKPGKSKQDYQTPPALLDAIKQRLRIEEFSIDLAADADNAIVHRYYDEEIDALHPDVPWNVIPGQWAWLNPPYADIFPWVQKAVAESAIGAHIVMLVPAAVGANWWRECVEPFAYTVFLNGRIQFVGAEGPYPKDCALLFYTPWGFKGSEIWRWRDDVPKLQ